MHILLLKEGIVIQVSHRGWKYKFYFFSNEGSVYFNIKAERTCNSNLSYKRWV